MVVTLGDPLRCVRREHRPRFPVSVCRQVVVDLKGVVMATMATSRTRVEKIPMLGRRRRRRRAHRVATIPREGGAAAVVAAMMPTILRLAVIRPCLS